MATVLFTHAHPDDETLASAIAILHLVDQGHEVHILTFTLGEHGEVIPPELAHLAAEHDDMLGEYRHGELLGATGSLGAISHVLGRGDLDGRQYRDSGMAGTPPAADPRALVNADPDQIAQEVRALVERLEPALVVTYDPTGGYSHPDHIAVFDATVGALRQMTQPPPLVSIVTARSWVQERRAWLCDPANAPAAHSLSSDWIVPPVDAPLESGVVEDGRVQWAIEAPELVGRQGAALGFHRTQVMVDLPRRALSNRVCKLLDGREGFARVDLASGRLVIPDLSDSPGSLTPRPSLDVLIP